VDDKQKEHVSEAEKSDSTKDPAVPAYTHTPGVGDASQQTQEAERKSK
jgi:hypothetical protein